MTYSIAPVFKTLAAFDFNDMAAQSGISGSINTYQMNDLMLNRLNIHDNHFGAASNSIPLVTLLPSVRDDLTGQSLYSYSPTDMRTEFHSNELATSIQYGSYGYGSPYQPHFNADGKTWTIGQSFIQFDPNGIEVMAFQNQNNSNIAYVGANHLVEMRAILENLPNYRYLGTIGAVTPGTVTRWYNPSTDQHALAPAGNDLLAGQGFNQEYTI